MQSPEWAVPSVSRERGESDWSVISWIFLLALFEDWNDICFPPVLKHLYWFPWSFKSDGKWHSNIISHLSQQLSVHLIRAYGSVHLQYTQTISNPTLDQWRAFHQPFTPSSGVWDSWGLVLRFWLSQWLSSSSLTLKAQNQPTNNKKGPQKAKSPVDWDKESLME